MSNKENAIDVEVTEKEVTMNIYQKLTNARKDLKDMNLKKTGVNPMFKGKNYWELGDFLPHTLDIFSKYGLLGVFNLDQNNMEATIEITNTNDPVEKVLFKTFIAEAKGQSPIQALGSQMTYLRRYLWMNVMELSEFDMVDAPRSGDEKETLHTKGATPKQIEMIRSLYTEEEIETMLERMKKKGLMQLTIQEASKMIEARKK